MDEDDAIAEGLLENFHKLASEGDFWHEKDSGILASEGISGHLKVDIGFTATSNASEQRSGSWGILEALKGSFLSGI